VIVGFDGTTIRGNKTGVGYYTSRLLERLTRVDGEDNPIDELVVLSNRALRIPELPRCRVLSEGRFFSRALWMQAVLPKLLERCKPDLCHFTNFLGPRFTDTPYVVTFHDMTLELLPECHTWRKRVLTRTLSPQIARRARFIITPSVSAKNDVARLFSIPTDKIRAIPHAPDPLFRPRRDPGSVARIEARYGIERPYLLYVGTLEPRKNLSRAAAAFSRIAARFPEHRFYLAGDLGWRPGDLLRTLEGLPHRDRIVRLGYVAEEDLPALYSSADLFVYPSLYEGFGFPVVEAMACGAPVLTSSTSSLVEIAEGAAVLVDPDNIDAIAEAMDGILSDARARDAMRGAGLARAATFSWERSTRETLSVYEEALDSCRARGRNRTPTPSRAPVPLPSPASFDGREARAVLDTLAYAALFDYPLTLSEIHRSLIGVSLCRKRLSRILARHPLLRRNLDAEPPFHFLRGRRDSVASRREANRRTRELLHRERGAIDLVRRLPFVRMLAFSGATAHGNARDGDVDLFVVTVRDRVWAVALLAWVAMKLLRRRRTICVNYLLGEERLALAERDAFTASQLSGLKPIAGRAVYYRLVRANDWGARFLPNFWQEYRSLEPVDGNERPAGSFLWEVLLSFGGGFLIERLGRLVLGSHLARRFRHAGRPASVKLEENVIKLHFKDHGVDLSEQIESIVARDVTVPGENKPRAHQEARHVVSR
jgi:glycosyltransferase involved in cell wall biosynthesis